MAENTQDLSKFGYREKDMAADLLKAHRTDKDDTVFLGDGVTIKFNPNSGCVFLLDDDCNTAMMNGDNLEDWLSCPECGNEGFKEDIKDNAQDCCKEWLQDLK